MIINIAAAAKMPILGGPTVMSGQHTTGRYKSKAPTNKLVPQHTVFNVLRNRDLF